MRRFFPGPFLWTFFLALGCLFLVRPDVTAQSSAAIAPDALPEDLQSLIIEDHYVPVTFPEAGVIHALDGNVVVIHRSNRKAYLGMEGDTVHENDEFYTLPESRCRLKFTNEDVVSLAPETRFSVDGYASQKESGEKTSFFSMAKGKAMFYAMRLFRFKKVRFQVKTPTAVMGVRGTKFGAHVYWLDDQKAESRPLRVAESGRAMGPYLAQTGGGGTSVTIAACGDGSVDVNGNTLGPGEYFNSYTGTVGYDPSVLNGISGAAGVGGGTGGTGGGGQGGGNGDGGGGDGGLTGLVTDVTSTQTGTGTQGGGSSGGEGGGGSPPPLVQSGYFAALLRYDDGSPYLDDVFLSKTPNLFGVDAEHRADSILDNDYLIWKGEYTYVTYDNGSGKDISITTTATQLSSGYSYLAYGKWEHTGEFTGSGTFSFVDHSWWVEGLATPEAAIAAQKGSALYSGEAYGTMNYGVWSKDLSGSFMATANFDNASIQNFTLGLTGEGAHAAAIAGAGGAINPDGTFDLSGGVWSMTNSNGVVTVNGKEGHGRFFGPGAEEIGGDWAMEGSDGSNDVGAVGVFGGKEQN